MKALWFVRENLTQHPGGDTTQILQTAAGLRELGVQVELCSDSRAPLDGYDLVHLFHLDRVWENECPCRRAAAQRRPIVLSTIYWPSDEFDRAGRAGFQGLLARLFGSRAYENLRLAQRRVMYVARKRGAADGPAHWWSFARAVQAVLQSAAVLLPNSHAELEAIERRFNVRRPAVIVPNAADIATFGPRPGEAAGERRGVLCVGRIEARKNQLALIEALRGSRIPLTFVGQAGRYSARYYRRCLRAAGVNASGFEAATRMRTAPAADDAGVRFLGQQSPEALRELYRAAAVHACVSWYETPGLASLEAALCGCALAVTPGGCTREYFGDQAHYCRPDDPASIRTAIDTALKTPGSPALAQRVAQEFTWQNAAERTLKAYERATGGRSSR